MKTKSELAAERCAEFCNGLYAVSHYHILDFNDGVSDSLNAFRQYVERVSDAMQAILESKEVIQLHEAIKAAEWVVLPKVYDPLMDIVHNVMGGVAAEYPEEYAEKLHKALNEAGLKITEA
jgi:hypothetical protein